MRGDVPRFQDICDCIKQIPNSVAATYQCAVSSSDPITVSEMFEICLLWNTAPPTSLPTESPTYKPSVSPTNAVCEGEGDWNTTMSGVQVSIPCGLGYSGEIKRYCRPPDTTHETSYFGPIDDSDCKRLSKFCFYRQQFLVMLELVLNILILVFWKCSPTKPLIVGMVLVERELWFVIRTIFFQRFRC